MHGNKPTPQQNVNDFLRPPAWRLHHGRSRKPILQVLPDNDSPLYRVEWPDVGLSQPANLTRCKQAAEEWAERSILTQRNLSVGQRLKSLENFSWSASPVRLNGEYQPAPTLGLGLEIDGGTA